MKINSNIWGPLVGLIGIAIGSYLHFSSKEDREISYFIDNQIYTLFDTELIKEDSYIALCQNDSVRITENVYLRTISIWNSGNTELRPEDRRTDFVIELSGIEKVLDKKLIKKGESNLGEFIISEIDTNRFSIDWKYFDPGNGFRIQFIYTGEEEIFFDINAVLLKTKIKEHIDFHRIRLVDLLEILIPFFFVSVFVFFIYRFDKYSTYPSFLDNRITKNLNKIIPLKSFFEQDLLFSIIKYPIYIAFLIQLSLIIFIFYMKFIFNSEIPI